VAIVRVLVLVLASLAARADAKTLRIPVTSFDVAPASDRNSCEYVALGNDEATDIRKFEVRTPRNHLHHILLYAYLGENRDPGLYTKALVHGEACAAIGPPDIAGHTMGLLGAVRAGTYTLPSGYAVSIGPRQPIAIHMHAFNKSTRKTRRTVIRIKATAADPAEVTHYLEPIDVVTKTLELPPRTRTTYVADMVAPFPMNVAMVSSHQHRLGTRASIRPVIGGVEGEPIYVNRRWAEPPLRWLPRPIRLDTGDRLRLLCEWDNRSDETVRHGPAALDEMCNLNGYFFRDVDLPREARTGVGGDLVPLTPNGGRGATP
jgi:hypothetical protein